jgi:hypothetical protein
MNLQVGELSGSNATKELQETVIDLSKASKKQTFHIIILTYAMLFLTFVMACIVGVQVWLSITRFF